MIRQFGMFIVILALAGCSSIGSSSLMQPGSPSSAGGQKSTGEDAAQLTAQVELYDYGPAPELSNDVWLNADRSLRLADLRGKVVLIDMWTYG